MLVACLVFDFLLIGACLYEYVDLYEVILAQIREE
jgi:hypothetical protein